MNHTPFLLDIAEKEFFYAVLYTRVRDKFCSKERELV